MEALGFLRLSPKYPEQGFGMGSDQGASFQIWEETQPQGPGGHCWLKGPGAQRGCPRGWSMPSFLLRHPAALGLGTHPSHPLVTVLVSWGQSRSQPCRQAGGGGSREGGLHLPHGHWSVSLWKRQERDVWCPGLRSQPRDPTGLGVGAETLPLAPHSSRPPLLGPLPPLTGNRTIPVRASGACGDQGRLARAQRTSLPAAQLSHCSVPGEQGQMRAREARGKRLGPISASLESERARACGVLPQSQRRGVCVLVILSRSEKRAAAPRLRTLTPTPTFRWTQVRPGDAPDAQPRRRTQAWALSRRVPDWLRGPQTGTSAFPGGKARSTPAAAQRFQGQGRSLQPSAPAWR